MLGFQIEDIFKAALVFIRIGGILMFLPIFGDTPTPVRARIFIAAGLSMLFYHMVPTPAVNLLQMDVVGLGWIVIKELFIGFGIGFISKMAFDGILMAASLVGYQMGFGMANLLVPDAGQQLNGFTATHRIIVILIFLGLNLHYIFINAIAYSFTSIPLMGVEINPNITQLIIQLSADIFSISIQLAAPILVALLFTMGALGLVARTVPQMNVFTMSFPMSFFIGLLVYIASFPFFPDWMTAHFTNTNNHLIQMIHGLSP